jgi:HK97 family phage portal protein
MSLLVRTAPAPSRRFVDPNVIPAPSATTGGVGYRYVTEDAMRVAAVVACVGLRSGALAQIPLKSYVDGPVSKLTEPQPELLVAPSSQRVVVPSVWKIQMSISRDIWGYAAGPIKAVDASGVPSKVDWVCPTDIRTNVTAGRIEWWLAGQPIDSSLMFHVPSRWVSPGNPLGMSPLEHSGLVDLAKKAQDFGRDWFHNGAVPSAILYSDKELTGTQADDILTKMKARWSRRQPAVIGSGMKFEQVSVPANESQFIETMQRVAADIAISFNLPPSKIAAAVASGGDIKYQNLEMSTQQYLMDSINPDLVVTQEVIGTYQRANTYLRWSTGAFLRADLKTRYESYKVGLEAEFLTVEEVRGWEELPPLKEET